jgi:malic enzyme
LSEEEEFIKKKKILLLVELIAIMYLEKYINFDIINIIIIDLLHINDNFKEINEIEFEALYNLIKLIKESKSTFNDLEEYKNLFNHYTSIINQIILADKVSKRSNFFLSVIVDTFEIFENEKKNTVKLETSMKDKEDKNVNLLDAIKLIKPSALIGVSAQGGAFTKEICQEMAKINESPLIFALSNPTSKAECTPTQAYEWTNGKCVYASGSPFDPVTLTDGRKFVPGQGNNAYIFPGVGLGALACGASTITDNDFYVAAAVLAEQVSAERLNQGCAYPPLSEIRNVSVKIANAVAKNIYKNKRASIKPDNNGDYLAICKQIKYEPHY